MITHDIIFSVVIMLLLAGLSGFFSGSETALFSLSRARLLSYRQDKSPARRAIIRLMDKYHKTLIAIIFGNMLVNIGLSITNNRIFSEMSALDPLLRTIIAICVSVVILLIFGEIGPKSIALIYAEPIADKIAIPILYLRKLLFPLVWVADSFFSFVLDAIGRKKHAALSPEEYSAYLEMSASAGAFSPEELKLLDDAFKLRETDVSEIMIGRIETICARKELSHAQLRQLITTEKREFYPLVKNDLDDSEYFLSARKFFLADDNVDWSSPDAGCLFPAILIPRNTHLSKALSTMRQSQAPAALAVDEYGRTCGTITMKDIYSKLTGDRDNIHEPSQYAINQLDANRWLVKGMMPLLDLEELIGVELPEEFESSTLNGLFCEILGRIPRTNDAIAVKTLHITAVKVSHHRVVEFRVERRKEQPAEDIS